MFSYSQDSLAARMGNGGNPIYDDENFRYVLLNHKQRLMSRDDVAHFHIEKSQADQFYGDFYGLLKSLNVPVYLHWITTQFNGYDCSTDYNAENLDIYVPSVEEVNRIRNIHVSVNGL